LDWDEDTLLIAICRLIDQLIGHADAESDLHNLLAVCQSLGLDEEEVKFLILEAISAYQKGGAESLIRQIFVEQGDGPPGEGDQKPVV
jgi:hypothetical protein